MEARSDIRASNVKIKNSAKHIIYAVSGLVCWAAAIIGLLGLIGNLGALEPLKLSLTLFALGGGAYLCNIA